MIRARHQLELLDPLVKALDDYDELAAHIEDLDQQRRAVPYFFGERTHTLLTSQIEAIDVRLTELDADISEADATVEGLREREQQLLHRHREQRW